MPRVPDNPPKPEVVQEEPEILMPIPSDQWQSRSASRPPGVKVFATTSLSDFIAANLVNGSNLLILSQFGGLDRATVQDAFQEATNQNPQIMVHSDYPQYTYDEERQTLYVKLPGGSRQEYRKEQRELLEAAQKVVDSVVTAGMSDRAKALALSDWVSNNVAYDTDFEAEMTSGLRVDDNYRRPANATGGILDRKAVCTGYARTYELLAHLAGLETITIYGEVHDVAHTWNRVKVDGQWLNVDTTFNASQGTTRYSLITDRQITAIDGRSFDYQTALVDSSIPNFK